MPGRGTPDPLSVAARRVLLDALEALGAQRRAAIVVGARAVYPPVGAGAHRRRLVRGLLHGATSGDGNAGPVILTGAVDGAAR